MAKQKDAEPEGVLWVSVESACATWGLPMNLVEEWVAKGQFPAPRKFNARVLRYPREIVEAVHQLVKYGWLPLPELDRQPDVES